MPMWIILGVCAAVFVLVIAFAGAQGAFDGGMSDEEADVPPAQRLTDEARADDIAAVRFTPTLWGYRPAEVDDALSRLLARVAVQDARLAALGERVPEPGAEPSGEAPTDRSTDTPTGRSTDTPTGPPSVTGSGAATFLTDL